MQLNSNMFWWAENKSTHSLRGMLTGHHMKCWATAYATTKIVYDNSWLLLEVFRLLSKSFKINFRLLALFCLNFSLFTESFWRLSQIFWIKFESKIAETVISLNLDLSFHDLDDHINSALWLKLYLPRPWAATLNKIYAHASAILMSCQPLSMRVT